MKTPLVLAALLLSISINAAAANDHLYGTWRLISFTQTIVATGETTDIFGEAPRGFINYGRDGRVIVIIVKDERQKPADLATMTDQDRAALFKTMVAYAGTYSFDGKVITHHIDVSWNEVWTGTDQVRNVKFDGRKAIFTSNPVPRSQDGKVAITVVTWEKVE